MTLEPRGKPMELERNLKPRPDRGGSLHQLRPFSGTMDIELGAGVVPIAVGQLVPGGVANVFPDLHGEIPNPFVFLPPLATIDVVGLTLQWTSNPFAVTGNGSFTTSATVTALSGTVTVDPTERRHQCD